MACSKGEDRAFEDPDAELAYLAADGRPSEPLVAAVDVIRRGVGGPPDDERVGPVFDGPGLVPAPQVVTTRSQWSPASMRIPRAPGLP